MQLLSKNPHTPFSNIKIFEWTCQSQFYQISLCVRIPMNEISDVMVKRILKDSTTHGQHLVG